MRRTSVVTLFVVFVFTSVVSADSTVYLPVLTATKGATCEGRLYQEAEN